MMTAARDHAAGVDSANAGGDLTWGQQTAAERGATLRAQAAE